MQGGGKVTYAQQFEQELWQKHTSSVTKDTQCPCALTRVAAARNKAKKVCGLVVGAR